MWSYTINAAQQGIRHTGLAQLQAEPANDRSVDLTPFYLLHYTFDLNWRTWKFSKRIFANSYPPREIPQPPRGSPRNQHTFVRMMNEAMGAVSPWAPCRGDSCTTKKR